MLLAAALLASLATAPAAPAAPGDGLSLEPGPDPGPPPAVVTAPVSPVSIPPPRSSGPAAGLVATALGVGAAAGVRRRAGIGPVPMLPDDVLVVFVSGHGSGYADSFDPLIENLGLPPGQIRHFDYRLVRPTTDHRRASQDASAEQAAAGLGAYLAGLAAADPRRIYLVGFSKGGATLAELVAQWDEHPERRVGSVVGAALLDPPISAGKLGALQSVGLAVGYLPDDGGYEPVRCSLWRWACHDRRENLGTAAGVDVVVFRNPDSPVTSFTDRPAGLRVFDVADPGPSAWAMLAKRGPFGFLARVDRAHQYPKHAPEVAACIRRELAAGGSCTTLEPAEAGQFPRVGGEGARRGDRGTLPDGSAHPVRVPV